MTSRTDELIFNQSLMLSGLENYSSWKPTMKMVLGEKDLWGVVSGSEKLGAFFDEDDEDIIKHNKKQSRALIHIMLSVRENIRPILELCDTAKEAWEKVAARFDNVSKSRVAKLKNDLQSIKMEEGESLLEHLSKIGLMYAKLSRAGVKYSDEDKVAMVLNSLNILYFNFQSNMNRSDPELVPTYEQVCSQVYDEEQLINMHHPEKNQGSAFVVRDFRKSHHKEKNYQSSSNSVPVKSDAFCPFYKKKGHKLEECRRKSGACFYYGKGEHKIEDCNARKSKQNNGSSNLISQDGAVGHMFVTSLLSSTTSDTKLVH
ncbi:hypothetical protein R1flu_007058 [Riccia fluitans]|uniref:DUF4219 domain-containing protein n=1 Tax=Riccia fluitans TaxID=41844 RepID=A0ABD1YYV8_9MARC